MPEIVPSSTWIDKLSPPAARLALFALLVIAGALVWVALGITEPVRRSGPSDFDTYERVVAALKAGQGYYPALHQALLDGGYGTFSPLNWRTPLFLTSVSSFPSLIDAQMFLGLLTFFAWMLAVAFAYRRGGLGTAITAALVMAASLLSIGAYRAELSVELCTGTLILISVAAYGLNWRWLGIAGAVLALFVRELAVIYMLVCLVLAIRERRWTETAALIAGIVAYAAFYLWHISQLTALIGPADHAAAADWLQLGGPTFLLRTAAFNGILLVAPYWVAAIILVLGLVGLKSLPRAALTTVLYLLLFLFYGRPENAYWGALYAPLIALGLVWSAGTLGSLVRAATPRRSS